MAGMKWYKVWLVVPGTDGDAENGPCEPEWWNDMEQAPDGETAVRQANEKARRQWEEPNQYEPGAEASSDRVNLFISFGPFLISSGSFFYNIFFDVVGVVKFCFSFVLTNRYKFSMVNSFLFDSFPLPTRIP